jgi:hypothetical protein
MSMRDMSDQAFATLTPAPERSHVGLHPVLRENDSLDRFPVRLTINEHKAIGIDLALMALPPFTLARKLRPVLLGWQHGFF